MSGAVGTQAVELPEDHGRPTFASLTGAEVLRLRSRRLVVVALLAAVGIMALAVIGTFAASGEPTAQDRAAAVRAAADAEVQCRRDLSGQVPPDEVERSCTLDSEDFLRRKPFLWDREYRDGVVAVAAGFAALLFLIGASAGGAEWGARTMPALLYWEPRRIRVVLAKCLALAMLAVVASLAAQLLWLGAAAFLEAARGATDPEHLPSSFWSDSVGIVGRGALLAVLMGLLAFGLANLTRNTAAALGAAFVYFAVLENLIGFLRPGLVRWQIGTNVGALVLPGGISVPAGASGPGDVEGGAEILLSNLRGGLVLTTITLAVLVIASVLFVRRDVS